MYKVSIIDLRTGETPYREEFADLDAAKQWVVYMLPVLKDKLDTLKVNTRKEVDGVYEVAIRTDESLPLDTEEAKPVSSTTTKK